jgi:hypothetical protein
METMTYYRGNQYPQGKFSKGNSFLRRTYFLGECISGSPWNLFPNSKGNLESKFQGDPIFPGNLLPRGTYFCRKPISEGNLFPEETHFWLFPQGTYYLGGTNFLRELRETYF